MPSPLSNKKAHTLCVCGHLLSPGESVNVPESSLGEWETSLVKAKRLVVLKTSRPGIVQVLHAVR